VGRWFLQSGIQEAEGGVARYYRSDTGRNNPVSTEITGYAVSTFVYLHALTGEQVYLDRAAQGARFLARTAWDAALDCMPFEYGASLNGAGARTYFFDSGIIVRGLLAAWRATGEDEFRDAAARCGRAMLRDFAAGDAKFHPILTLPDKRPVPRDERWSRSVGCYQLKSALAWRELFEATGDAEFDPPYCAHLEESVRTHMSFLPGHHDRLKVMDRLHAYSYFLEGMLPCAAEPRCVEATRQGIALVAGFLREIGPQFERSDVYAQLLRARLFADWNGVLPLDREAAEFEAAQLAGFQCEDPDPRIDGGFWFGRKGREWLPYVNPVSAGFALQALAMWEQHNQCQPATFRHMLI
jgi:hypothetical protein